MRAGSWIIEVQHSSDHDRDGTWHELDRTSTRTQAQAAARWFRRRSGYAGRRVRIRGVADPMVLMPRANTLREIIKIKLTRRRRR